MDTQDRIRIGAFLIERNWLKTSQVFEILKAQEKRQKSEIDVVMDVTGMAHDQVMHYSHEATVNEIALFRLLEQKSLLKGMSADDMSAKQLASRPPFGALVTELDIAPKEDVNHWLLTYFTHVCEQLESAPQTGQAPSTVETTTESTAIEAVDEVEYEPPQTGPLDCEESLVQEYVQSLNEDARQGMEDTLMRLDESQDADARKECLVQLYRDMHSFKGSAGFVGAIVSQQLMHNMEDLLSLLQTYVDVIDHKDCHATVDFIFKGMDFAFLLKDVIAEHHDETPYLEEQSEMHIHYMKSLISYTQQLSIGIQEKMADVDMSDMF